MQIKTPFRVYLIPVKMDKAKKTNHDEAGGDAREEKGLVTVGGMQTETAEICVVGSQTLKLGW